MKIKVLSDNLANQIAAGEVVERPASVIKELVENSIDAGAKRIQVDIELGGRRLMRVTDDGEGMTRDDAILAFERHATSKITTLDDLSAISTLGFRGEALASISSVAKVELITKTDENSAAARVLIEGGRLIDVKDAARSRGTTISVRDLFFNTPARRKFMRSEATENYHLTTVVTHYALAHPEIAFALINNGREVLRVSPARDLRERAYQIFGAGMLDSLLPVSGGREYVAKIFGFVSAPRERRTTRDAQYFFVNNRFVRDKIIAGGLIEGFRSVLPHGVYPVAFLFLEMPHDEIDVNVHPAKTEVRFRRSEAIKEVIAEAVRESLAQAGILELKKDNESPESGGANDWQNARLPVAETASLQGNIAFGGDVNAENIEIAPINPVDALADELRDDKLNSVAENLETEFIPPENSAVFSDDFENKAQTIAENNKLNALSPLPNAQTEALSAAVAFKDQQTQFNNSQQIENLENIEARHFSPSIQMPPVDSARKVVKTAEVEMISAAKISPLGQLHNSFIIATDDEGLLLIDQHVAHERILFDKFRRQETARKIESQNLLLPETIDLTPAQSEAFAVVEEELENLGFGVMRLSGRTVAIKSVPTDLPAAEVKNLLAEVLDNVEAEKRGGAKATLRDSIAASLACKAAVKINMKLTPEKMRWLIDRLLYTSSPTTCPHGRPVILRLTMKDIERGFHRT